MHATPGPRQPSEQSPLTPEASQVPADPLGEDLFDEPCFEYITTIADRHNAKVLALRGAKTEEGEK